MKWGYGVIPVGPSMSTALETILMKGWTQKAPKGWPLKTCRAISSCQSQQQHLTNLVKRSDAVYILSSSLRFGKNLSGWSRSRGRHHKIVKGKNGDQYLGRGLVTSVSISLVEKVWYYRILIKLNDVNTSGWAGSGGFMRFSASRFAIVLSCDVSRWRKYSSAFLK